MGRVVRAVPVPLLVHCCRAPPMNKSTWNRLWRRSMAGAQRWFAPTTFLVGVSLCAIGLVRLFASADLDLEIGYLHVAGSFFLVALIVGFSAFAWQNFLAGMNGPRLDFRAALHQTALVLIGKYVPGKISGIAARVFANHPLCSSKLIVSATLVEQLSSIVVAALIGAGCYLLYRSAVWPTLAAVCGFLFVFLAPVALRWLARCVRRLRRQVDHGTDASLSVDAWAIRRAIVWQIAIWLALSILLFVLANMVAPIHAWHTLVQLAGAYALAVVAGQAAFVFPGGIGPREGSFVWLASGLVPANEALAMILSMRIATSMVDMVACMGYLLFRPAGVSRMNSLWLPSPQSDEIKGRDQ